MAKGDYVVMGSGTLPVSAAGTKATVTVTATGAAAGDTVIISLTSVLPWKADLGGFNGIYVYSVGTDEIVVKSMYPELQTAVTFNYIVFDAA